MIELESPQTSQIFISFTHKDNAKLVDDEQGWIDRFHEALQVKLNQLWGGETRIWRDPKIGGNDLLTPIIQTAIEQSSVLVSVLSPSYAHSKWCNDELRMFCEAASRSGGLQLGSKSRIVKAIKTPISATLQHQLDALGESRGYPFYRLDERGVPWEFDPRLGPAARQEFLCQVNELAHDLCKTLEGLLGMRESRREVAAPSGNIVYIAETSSDVAADAERLRRELEQFGHTVVPDAASSYAPNYADRVQAYLARARLSIHQVGSNYGIIPEGDDRSVVIRQYQLAGEEAQRRSDFLRLTWMPQGLRSNDPRQRAFIEELQTDPHLLVTSLEDLKTSVQDALRPRAPAVRPPPVPNVPTIYLICDPVDNDAVQPLEDWLFNRRFEVVRQLASGDERQLREDHEENLKTCDYVLIYHGRTNEFWLRTKLRDLQKAFGNGRKREFAGRIVFIGEPMTPEKERFRSNDITIVRSSSPFDPSMLAPFIRWVGGVEPERVP